MIRSAFSYESELVPDCEYDPDINWNKSEYFDQSVAFEINCAYDYVWPAVAYWSLYRVARTYPYSTTND